MTEPQGCDFALMVDCQGQMRQKVRRAAEISESCGVAVNLVDKNSPLRRNLKSSWQVDYVVGILRRPGLRFWAVERCEKGCDHGVSIVCDNSCVVVSTRSSCCDRGVMHRGISS